MNNEKLSIGGGLGTDRSRQKKAIIITNGVKHLAVLGKIGGSKLFFVLVFF